jgi:hypothetical protein
MSIEPLQSASDFCVCFLHQLPQVRVSNSLYVLRQPPIRSEDGLCHFIEVIQPNDLAALFGQLDFFLLCSGQSISLKPVGFSACQHVRLCRDRVCLLP